MECIGSLASHMEARMRYLALVGPLFVLVFSSRRSILAATAAGRLGRLPYNFHAVREA